MLYGFDAIAFSNERSASSATLEYDGQPVNHQWSKGWAFERASSDCCTRASPRDLDYFSLLRPLSELAVAERFARTTRYDDVFSSCNRNFRILGPRPADRWCGQCPKCHFVFLALAPFMPKPRLLAIFGRNLLDDARSAPAFDALMEYRDHKPFECVGEGIESRAAMAALAARAEWREDALVARFADEILPQLDARELALAPLLVPRRRAPHSRAPAAALEASMRIADLAGRRVAVWGYGREGRAALAALRARLPRAAVDACSAADARRRTGARTAFDDAHWRSRRQPPDAATLAALRRRDQVARHQRVPAGDAARRSTRGTRFTSGTALWFAEHPEARVIAVTGTKGKSTVSALIAHLLRALGRAHGAGRQYRPAAAGTARSAARCRLVGDRTVELPDARGRPRSRSA